MRRVAILPLLVLGIGWVAAPFLYRASWAVTGAPVATRIAFPLPRITPEKIRLFHLDTTLSTPPERSPRPVRPFVPDPKNYRNCRPPRPDPRAAIILFGVGRGEALSTVALGRNGGATGVVDLIVEPGVHPLYLVLSASQTTIWRFKGATGRISRVVLLASPKIPPPRNPYVIDEFPRPPAPYAGVTGVPAERVTTLSPRDCFYINKYPVEGPRQKTAASAQLVFGRDPVVMAAGEESSAVRLPSGLAANMVSPPRLRTPRPPDSMAPEAAPVPVIPSPASPWPDGRQVADALGEWPGGLVSVRPDRIVSAVPVRPETFLSGPMGVRQLIEAGDVRPAKRGDQVEYRIRRPIVRLPAGAPDQAFVLEPWVPLPKEASPCLRRRTVVGLPFSYPIGGGPCAQGY